MTRLDRLRLVCGPTRPVVALPTSPTEQPTSQAGDVPEGKPGARHPIGPGVRSWMHRRQKRHGKMSNIANKIA